MPDFRKTIILTKDSMNRDIVNELNKLYQQEPDWTYRMVTNIRLLDLIEQPSTYILILLLNQKLIGALFLCITETICRKIAIIEEVIIDKKYRGRGHGNFLMKTVDSICKEENIDLSQLTVNKDKVMAQSLYLTNDFIFKNDERFMKKSYRQNHKMNCECCDVLVPTRDIVMWPKYGKATCINCMADGG